LNIISGREIAIRALVGSHNYNLNTPESDKDYKYFVLPTFSDLYDGKQYSENHAGSDSTFDYSVHDIRKMPHLFWKANINFLEVMFSVDCEYYQCARSLGVFIHEEANNLATMNLPYLYQACRGMSLQKQKDMDRDSPGRHANFVKFGYDTKSACHAVRVLDFLDRMKKNCFNFKQSIWYEDDDPNRDLLLEIKSGHYSREEIGNIIKTFEAKSEKTREVFEKQRPNEDSLRAILEDLIKGIVKVNLIRS